MSEVLSFEGRVALITGAAGGLGREYALLLARRGARILVNDIANAARVVDEIEAAGGEAIANSDSVIESSTADAMVAQALDHWGRLDIVINNAGIGGGTRERVVATHLFGTANVIQSALPIFESASYGRIVNTSSGAIFGLRGTADYAAAKGGIFALSRVIANEYRSRPEIDIKVNAIMPVAQTSLLPVASDAEFAAMMEVKFAASRVAPFVAALCHEYVPCTGETFTVGGGRAARVLLQTTNGYFDDDPTPEAYMDHFAEILSGANPIDNTEGTLADLLGRAGHVAISIADVFDAASQKS